MNFGIAINDGYGNRCENTKKIYIVTSARTQLLSKC